METKTCTKCGKNKPINEFVFRNKILEKRASRCCSCTREQINSHYSDNKDYYKPKAKKRKKILKEELERKIWDYLLSHPCVDCGQNNLVVLEFDHVRGTKKTEIAILLKNVVPWATIEEEITKCDVRCSNCHKIKTAKEKGYKKFFYTGVSPLASNEMKG